MAFIPSNILRWSPYNLPGPTLYGYETLDSSATVSVTTYFDLTNINPAGFEFNVNDQINCSCSDGIVILRVASLDPTTTEATYVSVGPNSVNTAAIQNGAVTRVKTTGLAYDDLSNLASVAINSPLIPAADDSIDLGMDGKRWNELYATSLQAGHTNGNTMTLSGWDVDGAAKVDFFTITSSNTPTGVLGKTVTATTQTPLTGDTTIATTEYVDDAVAAAGGGGANTALSNLAAVAINTSLISDADVTDDLGSITNRWNNVYAANITTDHTAGHTAIIGAWDVDGASLTPFITLTANNTPTCVLASGVTATTQSPGDNSTKIATTAYADAAGGGGGMSYVNQNTSSVTMAANTTYGCNNGASLITYTLPASAAAGDVFEIVGNSSGGWTLVYGSGQSIRFGNIVTTTTTGSLSSSNRGDCVKIICIVANTTFSAYSSVGNITWV